VSLPEIEDYLGHKIPAAALAPELLAAEVVPGAPPPRSHRPPHGGPRRGGGGGGGNRRGRNERSGRQGHRR